MTIAEDPRQCWGTPHPLFDTLHRRHRFNVDAAANDSNHLLPSYWTQREDGIAQLADSANDHLRAFLNPPYSHIDPWAEAVLKRFLRGAVTVMLVPAMRTDRDWFHLVLPYAKIVFVKGRIRFNPAPGITPTSPFETSMLLVFGDKAPAAIDVNGAVTLG